MYCIYILVDLYASYDINFGFFLLQNTPWSHEPLNIDLNSCVLTATWWGVHESKFTDFTLEIWTPKFRWIPAQRIHTKMPIFHEAHLGPWKKKKISYFLFDKTKEFSNKNPPLASQSTQYLLSSSCSMRFKSSWRRFCITFSRSTSDLVFREAILPTIVGYHLSMNFLTAWTRT